MIVSVASLCLTCVFYTTVTPCTKEFFVPDPGHKNDYALDRTPNASLTVGTAVECLRECSRVECLAMNICPDSANPGLINCGLYVEISHAKTFSSVAGCRYLEFDKCPGPKLYDASSDKCVCSPIWMSGVNCDIYYKEFPAGNSGMDDHSPWNDGLSPVILCHIYCSSAYNAGLRAQSDETSDQMAMEIKPDQAGKPFTIKCYLNWGGWNMIEMRQDNCPDSLDSLGWSGFETGTLNFTCAYFLGLEKTYRILQTGVFELDVFVVGEGGFIGHAYYENFRMGDRSTKYTINWDSYRPHSSQPADNGFEFGEEDMRIQGHGFATRDNTDPMNCAVSEAVGWWYGQKCPQVNLHLPMNTKDGVTGQAAWPKDGSLKKLSTLSFALKLTQTY